MDGDPTLLFRLFPRDARQGFRQPLAGCDTLSDAPLAPWAVRVPALSAETEAKAPSLLPWSTVYDGPGLLAGATEHIRAETSGDRFRVLYSDGEIYEASPQGARRTAAAKTASAIELDGVERIERILGAPAALALAIHGRHLLHASALGRRDGAVVALTAESGGGKSTLAAAAARAPGIGWTRLADDQLAVRLGAAPAALPHFPQLKLAAGLQYPTDAPASRPLAAVVAIAVDEEARNLQLERATAAEALSILTAATVASRLFDRALLTRHFAACAETARAIPCYRLTCPRDLSRLDETLEALATILP